MLGRQSNKQSTLFIPGDIRDYIPDDHILVKVDRVLDLSWLESEVRQSYSCSSGRPSIAPESALRLMLAGFFLGFVHDRKLMREAQVNLAIRWFAGYSLNDRLPDHSSLTRIRQRWGEGLFLAVFEKTVSQCMSAGLVSADTVHIDATLVRADVSWDAIVSRHAGAVIAENENDGDDNSPSGGGKKRVCTSDPDATVTRNVREGRNMPSYRQHTAVDDKAGIVVDVKVSTGSEHESRHLISAVDRVTGRIGSINTVTADKGYSGGSNYALLEERGISPLIIAQEVQRKKRSGVPIERFSYDSRKQTLTCPCGKKLTMVNESGRGMHYKAKRTDCSRCMMKGDCLSARAVCRYVRIPYSYDSLLRARRKKQRGWSDDEVALYRRHKHMVEGVHGEGKACHGLSRAIRRGMSNMGIQSYLTAAVINLKRLAAFMSCFKGFLSRYYAYTGLSKFLNVITELPFSKAELLNKTLAA